MYKYINDNSKSLFALLGSRRNIKYFQLFGVNNQFTHTSLVLNRNHQTELSSNMQKQCLKYPQIANILNQTVNFIQGHQKFCGNSTGSDQTAQMRRLVRTFAVSVRVVPPFRVWHLKYKEKVVKRC